MRGVSFQVVRVLVLIAFLISPVFAQNAENPDNVKWIKIQEMSGALPGNPGLEIYVFIAEIARREDGVKVVVKAEYPWGSPPDLFTRAPAWFDKTSVRRIQGKINFDCATKTIKRSRDKIEFWTFNGKKYSFSEFNFKLPTAETFSEFFCEQTSHNPSKSPPQMKPKPTL